MSYSETVEERGKYRVRLVVDDFADEPYNDGGAPIVQMGSRPWSTAEQVGNVTSYNLDDGIVEAAARWGTSEPDTFERYVRIFHGATRVQWWDSRGNGGGDYVYAALDPADWREQMGVEVERIAAEDMLSEWRAYCEGDVYGCVVEERVTWRMVNPASDETWETWEEVDSCWGYYGHEWAEQAAREALDAFA